MDPPYHSLHDTHNTTGAVLPVDMVVLPVDMVVTAAAAKEDLEKRHPIQRHPEERHPEKQLEEERRRNRVLQPR